MFVSSHDRLNEKNSFNYFVKGLHMQVPSSPKGTRDFYPADQAFQEFLFASWHKTCRRYGFELIDGPMFEQLSVYTQKSGNEIEKQLYTFEDKGQRMMALRPEMTPTLARMVAAQGLNIKRPIRWYSIPRLFRYEKMQKGRLREFFQLNMDILGIDDSVADAELIAASIDLMRDLGLDATDFNVHISSRNLLEQLLTAIGCATEQLPGMYALLDKKHKIPAEDFATELAATVFDATIAARVMQALSAQSLDEVALLAPDIPAVAELRLLLARIADYGMAAYVSFDIGIVRGLAYYTGTVFEVFDKKRSMRAIAGGGRYDHLVKSYGGPDTPAVGFAAGDVVLADLLREKGILPPASPRAQVYVAVLEQAWPSGAIKICQEIRNVGISCEYSLKSTGLGKQFKQADTCGAKLVIIAGGDEELRGCVKVKNMQSGEEIEIQRSELHKEIAKRL